MQDLSGNVVTNQIEPARLAEMSNEDAIDNLSEINVIGCWSEVYVLLGGVRRLDIFPREDNGVQENPLGLFGLDTTPKCHDIRSWHLVGVHTRAWRISIFF